MDLHAFNSLQRLQDEPKKKATKKTDGLDALSEARSGHGNRRTALTKFNEDYLRPGPRQTNNLTSKADEAGFEHLLDSKELDEWKTYQQNLQKAVYDARTGRGPAAQDNPLVAGSAAIAALGPQKDKMHAVLASLQRSKTFSQRVNGILKEPAQQGAGAVSSANQQDAGANKNSAPSPAKHGRRAQPGEAAAGAPGIILHSPSHGGVTNVLHLAEAPPPGSSNPRVPGLSLKIPVPGGSDAHPSLASARGSRCLPSASAAVSQSGVHAIASPMEPAATVLPSPQLAKQGSVADRDRGSPQVKFQLGNDGENSEDASRPGTAPSSDAEVYAGAELLSPRQQLLAAAPSTRFGRRKTAEASIGGGDLAERHSPASPRGVVMCGGGRGAIDSPMRHSFNGTCTSVPPCKTVGSVSIRPSLSSSSLPVLKPPGAAPGGAAQALSMSLAHVMNAQAQAHSRFLELLSSGGTGAGSGGSGHAGSGRLRSYGSSPAHQPAGVKDAGTSASAQASGSSVQVKASVSSRLRPAV